jgi:hypothetical protein
MMKRTDERYEIASALSAALETVIDVCLETGITSPELESMVRAQFVHRALARLPRHRRTGRGPSDVNVALAVGVHRLEVKRIREGGTQAKMKSRERSYWKGGKVLRGWMSDARFANSAGNPLDLPIELNDDMPSFEELVIKYLPGARPASVLKDLTRRGFVQMLPDEIVRFRSLNPSKEGITPETIAEAATRIRRLGSTLLLNLHSPHKGRLYAEMKPITIDIDSLAMAESRLAARAKAFLTGVENEIRGSYLSKKRTRVTKFGVSIFSWPE